MKVTMEVGVIVRNSREGESKERRRRMDKLFASYKCPKGEGCVCVRERSRGAVTYEDRRTAVGGGRV